MLFVTEFWIRCITLHSVSKVQVYVRETRLMHIVFDLLIRAVSAALSLDARGVQHAYLNA